MRDNELACLIYKWDEGITRRGEERTRGREDEGTRGRGDDRTKDDLMTGQGTSKPLSSA